MVDTVLSQGRWHATPDGQYRLNMRGPGELLHLLTEKANRKSGWKWVTTQATLAKMFQVSVRTIRYWISALRSQGRILTEYTTDERGYRSKTIFMLPNFCGKPRGNVASSPKTTTRSTSTSSLRASVTAQPQPDVFDLEDSVVAPNHSPLPHPRKPQTHVAPSKFGIDEKDAMTNLIDEAKSDVHNGSEAVVNKRVEVDGTATQQVIAWWLKYRKVRPDAGEIAAMGGAVRECLTRSRSPYTVQRAQELLFDLMRVGRDCAKIFASETGMISRTLGRGRRVTWWQERKPSTVWSAVERPGLYRQRTDESRPSSPSWQPTSPSTEELAARNEFDEGLIGKVERSVVQAPVVRDGSVSILSTLTSSLLYTGGKVDTGLSPYTDVRLGEYTGGPVGAW